MNTRAAIYSRISRAENGDRLGSERHTEICRQYCDIRGYEVVEVYEDNDISAVKHRPGYEQLLADLPAGKFDLVVAYEQDRLSRDDEGTWAAFRKAYLAAGFSVIEFAHGGSTDLSSAYGRFTSGVVNLAAALEREVIIERVRDKHRELADKGFWHGGTRPFGYRPVKVIRTIDDKPYAATSLEIDEDEARLVREAADRILEGTGSLYGICRDWNERGESAVGTKAQRAAGIAALWSPTSLRRMLKSPTTAGLRQHGEHVVEADWDAILEGPVWERLISVLNNPNRRPATPATARTYPLRGGVLKCGECGQKLTSMFRNGLRHYGCRSDRGGCGKVFVRAEPAESYILGLLLPLADDPRVRALFTAEAGAEATEARQLIADNAEDMASITMWADMLTKRETDRATFVKQTAALQKTIEDRQSRLLVLRGTSALDKLGDNIAAQWDFLSDEDRRSVLLAIVKHIEVRRPDKAKGNKFQPGRLYFLWASSRIEVMQAIDEYASAYFELGS